MYYVYVTSGPSLLIESTDSMILLVLYKHVPNKRGGGGQTKISFTWTILTVTQLSKVAKLTTVELFWHKTVYMLLYMKVDTVARVSNSA